MTLDTQRTFCLEKCKGSSDLDIMTEVCLVTETHSVTKSNLVSVKSAENGNETNCPESFQISEAGKINEKHAPEIENEDKHGKDAIQNEYPVKGIGLKYPDISKIEIKECTYQGLGGFVVEEVFQYHDSRKASFGNDNNFKDNTHDHMLCDSSNFKNEMQTFEKDRQIQTVNETNRSVTNDENVNETNRSVTKDENVNETNRSVTNDENVNETNRSVTNDGNVNDTNRSVTNDENVNETNRSVTNDGKMHANQSSPGLSSNPRTNSIESECSDDDLEFHRPRLRKASSLKEVIDFQETKGCKKMVRFADALGLDLESVRHVFDTDKPPYIPSSAKSNLKTTNEPHSLFQRSRLEAKFNLDISPGDFIHNIIFKKVCLNKVEIKGLSICGFVKVLNIAFQKSVRVRYTTNNWISFSEIMTSYHSNQEGGQIDQFIFNILAPPTFFTGERLEFAISYTVAGNAYWDNNDGKNYAFECVAMEQNKNQTATFY